MCVSFGPQVFGRECWGALDASGLAPIDIVRRGRMWRVEAVLSRAEGEATQRTLLDICHSADAGQALPPPSAAWVDKCVCVFVVVGEGGVWGGGFRVF